MGDLISYDGHVAIVHSEKWGVSQWTEGGIFKDGDWDLRKINYDVIHAYGRNSYKLKDQDDNYLTPFSRKVTITGDYISEKEPQAFGRIKLWD